jgi:ABC-type ATPase involved in cell division
MATHDLDLVKSLDTHIVELQHGAVAYDSAEEAGGTEQATP